jgi:hypothetical protein
MIVTLYRQVGKDKNCRCKQGQPRTRRHPADLAGPYFLRFSLEDGTRPWELVGADFDAAVKAQKRKQEYFRALRANVLVLQEQQDTTRLKITDPIYQWLSELQTLKVKDPQGKSGKTIKAYAYRLGFFLDFSADRKLTCLDHTDRGQLLRYVKFLQDHEKDLSDRTVYNIFATGSACLPGNRRSSEAIIKARIK